jgi:hypothetical protein
MPGIGRTIRVADLLGDFLTLPDGTYGAGRFCGAVLLPSRLFRG